MEERAELERTAKVDHVPSGWTKANVEDVAREISLQYRSASGRMETLNKALESTRWNREQLHLEAQAAYHRWVDRRAGMSVWAKAANVFREDPELQHWRVEQGRATRGWLRADKKERAIAANLKEATAVVWTEYNRVKPEAERVLAERQQTAAAASEQLRVLDAGERIVHNKVTEWHDQKFDAAEKARESQTATDFWRATVEAGRELRKEREAEQESARQQERPRHRLRL